MLWRQRSRADWLKDRVRNTKIFHAKASHRKRTNTIQKLKNERGEWISGDTSLKELVMKYFNGLFESELPRTAAETRYHFNHIRTKISEIIIAR